MPHKILVVDDEEPIRTVIEAYLTQLGHHVDSADGFESALSLLKSNEYDIIITDKNMPHPDGSQESGLSLLEYARKYYPHSETLLMTGYPTINTAVESMKMGAFDYILKPFSMETLKEKVGRILEYKNFINPDNMIQTYKTFNNEILDLLSNKEDLTLDGFHKSINSINEKIDHFFKAQQKWEKITLEQRKALDKIAEYATELMDTIDKTAPHYELVEKVLAASKQE